MLKKRRLCKNSPLLMGDTGRREFWDSLSQK